MITGESKTPFSLLPLPLTRILALSLSICMIIGDPSWASGIADFARVSFSSDLRSLTVPSKFGMISDQWNAPNLPTSARPYVVLIQDLHANVGVQKNIAGVIENLYDRYGFVRILTEAGFTTADVSLLRSYSSKRVSYKVEDRLLRKALLSGVDLAAARVGQGGLSPMHLEGVDDPLLYLANVEAFRDLTKVGPEAAREWKSLRDLLMPGAAPQLRHHLELTEKLLELKLLDDEWLEYREHRDLTPRTGQALAAAIAAGERFYQAAEARNGAMAANVLVRTQDGQPSVLVTGGFHTASIAHELKQHQISFAVVTPVVDRLDQDELYTRSMIEPPHETVAAFIPSFRNDARALSAMARQVGDNQSPLWIVRRAVEGVRQSWNGRPIEPGQNESFWSRIVRRLSGMFTAKPESDQERHARLAARSVETSLSATIGNWFSTRFLTGSQARRALALASQRTNDVLDINHGTVYPTEAAARDALSAARDFIRAQLTQANFTRRSEFQNLIERTQATRIIPTTNAQGVVDGYRIDVLPVATAQAVSVVGQENAKHPASSPNAPSRFMDFVNRLDIPFWTAFRMRRALAEATRRTNDVLDINNGTVYPTEADAEKAIRSTRHFIEVQETLVSDDQKDAFQSLLNRTQATQIVTTKNEQGDIDGYRILSREVAPASATAQRASSSIRAPPRKLTFGLFSLATLVPLHAAQLLSTPHPSVGSIVYTFALLLAAGSLGLAALLGPRAVQPQRRKALMAGILAAAAIIPQFFHSAPTPPVLPPAPSPKVQLHNPTNAAAPKPGDFDAVKAAQERVQLAQESVGSHLKSAQQTLEETRAAARAARANRATAEAALKAARQLQQQAADRLNPEKAYGDRLPADSLTPVLTHLQQIDASTLVKAVQSVRSDAKGVPSTAISRLASLQVSALRAAGLQDALNAAKDSTLTPAATQTLVKSIQSTMAALQSVSQMQSSWQTAQPLLASPSNAGLSGPIGTINRVFASGDIGTLSSQLESLLAHWATPYHGPATEQALDRQAAQIDSQVGQMRSQLAENGAELHLSQDDRQNILSQLEPRVSGLSLHDLNLTGNAQSRALKLHGRWSQAFDDAAAAVSSLDHAREVLANKDSTGADQTKAINEAVFGWGRMMKAKYDIYAQTSKDLAEDMANSIPTDPAVLAQVGDGLKMFNAYKADRLNNGPKVDDSILMRDWYGSFILTVLNGYQNVDMQNLLNSVIRLGTEDEQNLAAQESALSNAEKIQTQQLESLERAGEQVREETAQLEKLQTLKQAQADDVRRQVPDLAVRTSLTPNPADVKLLKDAIRKFTDSDRALKFSTTNAGTTNKDNFDKAIARLDRSLKFQVLSESEAAELTDAYFAMFDLFPHLMDQDVVDFTRQDKTTMKDLHEFMSQTAFFGLRYLGGVATAQLGRDGASGETLEHRLMVMAHSINPEDRTRLELFVKNLERTGGIGRGMGLGKLSFGKAAWKATVESYWDVLQAMNLIYGIKFARTNWDTLAQRSGFIYSGVDWVQVGVSGDANHPLLPNETPGLAVYNNLGADKKYLVTPAGGAFPIILGAANAIVNTKGAIEQAAFVVHGSEKPEASAGYSAAQLDPKVFGGLSWEIRSASEQPQDGFVYLQFPNGKYVRAEKKIGDVDSQPDKWQQSDGSAAANLPGHLFVTVNGVRYNWIASRTPAGVAARVNALRKAATAGALAYQTYRGLFSGTSFKASVVRIDNDYLGRLLAGVRLAGTFQQALGLYDLTRWKIAMNSQEGGWIHATKPAAIGEVKDGDKLYKMTKDGKLYLERQGSNGTVYWDDANGTPTYRFSKNKLLMLYNWTQGHFRNGEIYQVSRVAAQAALNNTSNQYSQRRSGSAALMPDADRTHMVQTIGSTISTYKLDPAQSVSFHGRTVTARPFYNDQKDWLGIVMMDPKNPSEFMLDKKTGEILSNSVYAYIGSATTNLMAYENMLRDGWNELDPVHGQSVVDPLLNQKGWEHDGVDGQDRIRDTTGDVSFLKWTDGSGEYVLDQSNKLEAKLYRKSIEIDKNDNDKKIVHYNIASTSLQSRAVTAELSTTSKLGVWIPTLVTAEPLSKTGKLLITGAPQSTVWRDATGNWHLKVVGSPMTVLGRTLAAGKNYDFKSSISDGEQVKAQTKAPFYRRLQMPVPVDLSALPGSVKETIGSETWYFFAQGPLQGTYVAYTKDGESRVDFIGSSEPGLAYEHSQVNATNDHYWSLTPVVQGGDQHEWTPGAVPQSVADEIKEPNLTASFLRQGDHYYLRVAAPSGRVYTFTSMTTPAGKRHQLALMKGQGGDLSVAEGIPDALMSGVPGVHKVNGVWSFAVSSAEGIKNRIHQLQEGGRFLEVLPAGMTLDDLGSQLGNAPVPATRQPNSTITYGAQNGRLRFAPYSNPADPSDTAESHAFTVLRAVDGGTFIDPESADQTPVTLAPGQLLIFGAGKKGLDQERAVQKSTHPVLRREPQSIAMLRENNKIGGDGIGSETLPAYLGTGATSVKGVWHADNKGQWTYFEVAVNGQFTDNVTGKVVTLYAGDVWMLDNPAGTSTAFAKFNQQNNGAFSVLPVGEDSTKQAYAQSAKARGLTDAKLHRGASLWTIPGTKVSGYPLFTTVSDPQAPTLLVVTQAGTVTDPFLGPITVSRGQVLVFQNPLPVQEAFEKALEGGVAVVLPARSMPRSIAESDMHSTALGGITLASKLTPAQISSLNLPTPMSPKALVQIDAQGSVVGQVVIGAKGLDWLAAHGQDYGYVQMGPGSHSVVVNGKARNLSGWVGIGDGVDEIPFSAVRELMKPTNGRNGSQGWLLSGSSDGPSVGTINFGVKAARYELEHPGFDRNILKPGITAALYYLDDKTPNAYLTKPQLDALGSRVVPIIQSKYGTWEPAFYVKETRRWHLLEVDPANHSLLKPQKAPAAIQPTDDKGNIKDDQSIAHGLLSVIPSSTAPAGRVVTVTAFVDFRPGQKKTDVSLSVAENLSDEELVKLPFIERRLQVMRNPDGSPRMTLDPITGLAKVVFVNKVNHQATIQTTKGDHVVSIEYFFDSAMKNPSGTMYFGPRGIEDPLFRVLPENTLGSRPNQIDEVYRTNFDLDAFGRRHVQTIHISGQSDVFYNPSVSPEVQQDRIWRAALRNVSETGPGVKIDDYLKEVRVASGETAWLNQFRGYEGLNALWQTQYNYDTEGHETGSSVRIGVTASERASLERFLISPESAQPGAKGPSVGAWNEATVESPVQLKTLRNATGGPLLPMDSMAKLGISENTWVQRSSIRTSWGTTQIEVRQVGDARHVLFEQGIERRLNVEFSGDNPIHTYLLNNKNEIIGEARFRGYRPASQIFTQQRLEEIASRTHIPIEQLRQSFTKVGIQIPIKGSRTDSAQHDTLIPVVGLQMRFLNGDENQKVGFNNAPPETELYLMPKDAPRGREIGRYSPEPPRSKTDAAMRTLYKSQGDFILNRWWQEADRNIPFGVLPESITLRQDNSYRRVHFAGTQKLDFKNLDGSWIKDLDEQPITEKLRKLQGAEVYVYQVENTNYSEQQLAILFTKDGTLVAEDFKNETVRPANGIGSIAAGTSTRGIERVYYDVTVPYRVPLLSLMTTKPLKDYLNPQSRSIGAEALLEDRFKQFEPLVNSHADAHTDDVVLRQVIGVHYEQQGELQKVELLTREREGLDRSKIFAQFSTYLNDTLEYKTRPHLLKDWWEDRHTQGQFLWTVGGFAILIGLFMVAARALGFYKRKSADKNALSETGALEDSTSSNGSSFSDLSVPLVTGQGSSLSTLLSFIDQSSSEYGFAASDLKLAHDKLKKAIEDGASRNRTFEDYFGERFDYYQNDWIKYVVKESEEENFLGQTSMTDRDRIDNLLLWTLLEGRMSNFSYGVPAFKSFLFKGLVSRSSHPTEAKDWLEGQVSLWDGIIRENMKGRGIIAQSDYLIYEDVQGLFRSAPFVRAYRLNNGIVPRAGSAEWKTFIERSSPSFFSLEGWQASYYAFGWLAVVALPALSFFALPAVGVAIGSATFYAVELALVTVLAGYQFRLQSIQRVKTQMALESVAPMRSEALQNVPQVTTEARRQMWIGSLFWTMALVTKAIWNHYVFTWLSVPTTEILHTYWIAPGGNLILLGMLWAPFVYFFFLDIFAFFYLFQAAFGLVHGAYIGIGDIKTWPQVQKRFNDAEQRFYIKGIPQGLNLSEERKHAAWAVTWNKIIDKLQDDDLLSEDEVVNYKFTLDHNSGGRTFSDISVSGLPANLNTAPKSELVQNRLEFYLNSMFMEMPSIPRWNERRSRTIMTPVYNEDVLYSMGDLNNLEKTGKTFLTHLIALHPEEWKNFQARLARQNRFTASDLQKLELLSPGQALDGISGKLQFEVRMWASYRFQPLSRTVRGIMNQREALVLQAQIEFPNASDDEIQKLVDQKFQYIVSYQAFADEDPSIKRKRKDLEDLMVMYPALQVGYVKQESGTWYSYLIKAKNAVQPQRLGQAPTDRPTFETDEIYKISLAGSPVKGMGEGKPENQTLMLRFAQNEVVETVDMNQDFDFEEALKLGNLEEEFNDPSVKLVGFPERINTQHFSLEGRFSGFADSVFVTLVQSFLGFMGVRFHYGHPDIWDANWARDRTGVSGKSYVNEDIIAGYDTVSQGGRIIYRRYVRAVKAREVSVVTTSGLFQKFGAGAAQQAISRYIYQMNKLSAAADRVGNLNIAERMVLFFVRSLTHFFGAIGYFLRKPHVKIANGIYISTVLFLGVSAFVSFPSALYFGLLGIFLSQAISIGGLGEMILEMGLIRGVVSYSYMVATGLVPFYQFHGLTFSSGVQKGLRAVAKYISTGRGPALRHLSLTELYGKFSKSHLNWSFGLLVFSVFAVQLWQNSSLIWSGPVILQALSGLLVPFIFNRGSTPRDVGFQKWKELMHGDVREYAETVQGIVSLRWMVVPRSQLNYGGSFFDLTKSYVSAIAFRIPTHWSVVDNRLQDITLDTEKGNVINRLSFIAQGAVILWVVITYGAAVAPFSNRRDDPLKDHLGAIGIGLVGALALFLPFAFLPWIGLGLVVMASVALVLILKTFGYFYQPHERPSDEILGAHQDIDTTLYRQMKQWLEQPAFLEQFRASQQWVQENPLENEASRIEKPAANNPFINEVMDRLAQDPNQARALAILKNSDDNASRIALMSMANTAVGDEARKWISRNLPSVVKLLLQNPTIVRELRKTRSALAQIPQSEKKRSDKNPHVRDSWDVSRKQLFLSMISPVLTNRQEFWQELLDANSQNEDAAIQELYNEAVAQSIKNSELRLRDRIPLSADEKNTTQVQLWLGNPDFVDALRSTQINIQGQLTALKAAKKIDGEPETFDIVKGATSNNAVRQLLLDNGYMQEIVNTNPGSGLKLPTTFWEDWLNLQSNDEAIAEARFLAMLWTRLLVQEREQATDIAARLAEKHSGAVAVLAEGGSKITSAPLRDSEILLQELWQQLPLPEQQVFLDLGDRKPQNGRLQLRLFLTRSWLRDGLYKSDPEMLSRDPLLEHTQVTQADLSELVQGTVRPETKELPKKKVSYTEKEILGHRILVGTTVLAALFGSYEFIPWLIQQIHPQLIPFTGLQTSDIALNLAFVVFGLVYGMQLYLQDYKNRAKGGATSNDQILNGPRWGLLIGASFGLVRAYFESLSHGSFFEMALGHSMVDALAGFLIGLAVLIPIGVVNSMLFLIPNFPIAVGGAFRRQQRIINQIERLESELRKSNEQMQEVEYVGLVPTGKATELQKEINEQWEKWVTVRHWQEIKSDWIYRFSAWLGISSRRPAGGDDDSSNGSRDASAGATHDPLATIDALNRALQRGDVGVENLRRYTSRFEALVAESGSASTENKAFTQARQTIVNRWQAAVSALWGKVSAKDLNQDDLNALNIEWATLNADLTSHEFLSNTKALTSTLKAISKLILYKESKLAGRPSDGSSEKGFVSLTMIVLLAAVYTAFESSPVAGLTMISTAFVSTLSVSRLQNKSNARSEDKKLAAAA